ncbi:interleukin-37 isoform X2 [Carlito syrichta]|uniref:Interleukin-1 n=1 Tax=Carlito syrichta TaxID=1868482 RepID=A0A3Q0DT93_CARSF|nr:interleukin-37 isoform X2 [Carlito syrichta]
MSSLENSGVKMNSEDWEKDEFQCCSGGSKLKCKEPKKFNLHAQFQQVLVLDCGILKAVPDRKHIHPEIFFVLASHLPPAPKEKGSPIFLAVSKGELCLYCDKDKGKGHPSLQLKKKKLMELGTLKEQECRHFIFYKSKVGSQYTLESAAHPGWFMCTSHSPNQPVEVTDKAGKKKHIEFSFHPVHKVETSYMEASD